jgi:acetyl-CoA acyltransferase
MSGEKAEALGLEPLAVFRSFACYGVDPGVMGIGPAFAIPKALKIAGIGIDDVDLVELNEAFASQAVYCVRELGLDPGIVNVNGGAIALGHPLGATGAKLTATLLHELKRRKGRYGVVSMCIAGGQGAAAVFERV